MKINHSMVCVGIFLSLLASGCSKIVTKENRTLFGQIEPSPSPTGSPDPVPTSSPVPTPVGCEPSRLGDLPGYAVYTKEDLKLSDVSVSRRAAASDAVISRSVVGLLLNPDAKRADLQTMHDLDVHTVGIPKGKATYGTSLSNKKSTALGGFAKAAFSMTANFHALTLFSNGCEKAAANATVHRTCVSIPAPSGEESKPQVCTLHFKGTNQTLNIADVPSPLLTGVNIVSVEVPAGSTLVANFSDVRTAKFTGVVVVFPKDVAPPTAYWNFPNAEDLHFKKTLIRGTVIAPHAEVKIDTQAGDANFWSRTLDGAKSVW